MFKWILVIILLSIPTFSSLLRSGYFPMHDDLQVMRIQQMGECFKEFQFPCRWVPDMGYQYGYPQFQYYGPLPYYLMTTVHFLGLNLFDAVKFGFILALVLGNITMFFLGSSLWGRWGGFLTSMAYAYLPFRASDLYSRGAMGESWAFVFLPLILLNLKRTADKPNLHSSVFLALSLSGLYISHNVSTLMFTPLAFLFIFIYSLLVAKKNIKQISKYILLAIGKSVALSASFFLPAYLEKDLAHTESLLSGYFNYLAHFVSIKQLFLTTFWGYGSSEIGPTDDLSFFVGPIHILLFIIANIFAILDYKKNKNSSVIIFLSTIFFLVSTFMTHQKSTFIWNILKPLWYLQFPWRFLVPTTFFMTLPIGYILTNLKQPILFFITLFLLLFLFNRAYFNPKFWINIIPQEKLSGNLYDKQLTISIFDYLPIAAENPPATPAPQLPQTNPQAGITNYRKSATQITFNLKAQNKATVTLPQFDFPNWKVFLDGKKIEHSHKNQLGLITFDVPSGDHQIVAKLGNTPIRVIGNLLSLASIIGITIIFKKHQHV